jgi:hypothetical protein
MLGAVEKQAVLARTPAKRFLKLQEPPDTRYESIAIRRLSITPKVINFEQIRNKGIPDNIRNRRLPGRLALERNVDRPL